MSISSFRATLGVAALATLAGFAFSGAAAAQSVQKECSTKYQAAKTAGTLNGLSWRQYYSQCAAEAKAGGTAPASAPAPTPVAAPAPAAPPPVAPAPAAKPTTTAAAPTATPAPAPGAAKPMSAGRAAFVARERQCGAEWRANKVSLIAATPGLTWPKYLSSCNARLKAAGQ